MEIKSYFKKTLLSTLLSSFIFFFVIKSVHSCFCVEKVSEKPLCDPVILENTGDGTGRIFIGELPGIIHIYYPDGRVLPEPFLDIRPLMGNLSDTGETQSNSIGLFSMAMHPAFPTNGLFYLVYTSVVDQPGIYSHRTIIGEFKVSRENKNKADNDYFRLILDIPQKDSTHDGGQILFGEDGYLYIFIGDGGLDGDTDNNAQNMEVLLGKVLRIDVDNQTEHSNYSVPADNPFLDILPDGVVPRPEIYAYGFRNPWRCGIDHGDLETGDVCEAITDDQWGQETPIPRVNRYSEKETCRDSHCNDGPNGFGKGRIICGDCGENRMEELDLIKRGGNYGWNNFEGMARYCYRCPQGIKSNPPIKPIYAYKRTQANRAVMGGVFNRGCGLQKMPGGYIYGNYGDGRIFQLLEAELGQWVNEEIPVCEPEMCVGNLSSTYAKYILSFGLDEYGEVYLLSSSNPGVRAVEGHVYKLLDPSINPEEVMKCGKRRPKIKTDTQINSPDHLARKEKTDYDRIQIGDNSKEPPTTLTTNGKKDEKTYAKTLSDEKSSLVSMPKQELESKEDVIEPFAGPIQSQETKHGEDQGYTSTGNDETTYDIFASTATSAMTSSSENGNYDPKETVSSYTGIMKSIRDIICRYLGTNFPNYPNFCN